MELGRIGIWSSLLRRGPEADAIHASIELERLGFETAWMPGGDTGLAERVAMLLGSTGTLNLAIGIVNVWFHPAPEVGRFYAAATSSDSGRLLIGLGIGHAPLVDRVLPGRYRRPFDAMLSYLDELDHEPTPIPQQDRVIGALGPRMIELSRRRAAGAHPYLVTPQHTRWARQILGAGALLAPEQHVILESDPRTARTTAREYMATYLELPHYLANFRRMGFAEEDLEGGGSDRMIDALVAWGDVDRVLNRVEEHFEAGADHVSIQVLVPGKRTFPLSDWKTLAAAIRERGSA